MFVNVEKIAQPKVRYRSDATLYMLAGACIKTHVDWLSACVYCRGLRYAMTSHNWYYNLVEHVFCVF